MAKEPSGEKRVFVKNSFYTFSSEYPGGLRLREKTSRSRRIAGRLFKALAALVLGAVFLCAGYFGVSVVSHISSRGVDEYVPQKSEAEQADLFDSDLFRAYTLSWDHVGDEDYIKKLIQRIKRHDGNAVVVEFKNEEGELLFSSKNFTASLNARFDNDTVRRMMQLFRSRGIRVIASFVCFRDGPAAEANPDYAVKYTDSSVNWTDSGENGSAWLNPYSKDAVKYLLSLIDEIADFGVSGFILKGLSFPSADDSMAFYPGEKDESGRHAKLVSFYNAVKKTFSGSVLTEVSAATVFDDEADPFCGTFSDLGDKILFDTSDRPDGYYIDRDEDYASFLSFLGRLVNAEECEAVIMLDGSETSNHLLRELKNAGYPRIIVNE